ncbi:MAG: DNA polymerase I [Desulfobacterales bacterium]|nr:DNA polymerase I [Desulfobacterales bacterium]MBF0396865.1 DNA polymerase I [Desulfobacterales bacterium]
MELYLIDGSAYIHRAYHAVKGLTTSTGIPTNAVFGFTNMIMKLVENISPKYLAIFFDSKGKTFRHDIYNKYKANRPALPDDFILQIPYIKEIIQALNIKSFELPGFEADDLIGTIALKAKKEGLKVFIITGDKDFIQLIDDKITILDPMKDETINVDEVFKKYSVAPDKIIDVMALAGDSADNIPGVTGIGIKTAIDLIKEFKNLENLYENINNISKKKQKENLIQFKELAFLSKKLVTIDTNIPIPFDIESLKFNEPDYTRLYEVFKTLEFKQFLKTLPQSKDSKKYQLIKDKDSFSKFIEVLKNKELFSINIHSMQSEILGLSFGINPNEAFYVYNVPSLGFLEELKLFLEDENIKKIGHNIKHILIMLIKYGISINGFIFDTMLASYLINPSKKEHNIDQIIVDFMGYKKIEYDDIAYSECENADIVISAYEILKSKLIDLNILGLLEKIEIPLSYVLMDMELTGISVNKDKLLELSKTFEHELQILEGKIYGIAGEEFNIRSPQQIGAILFDKLKLSSSKKTKKTKGYSTNVDVLNELALNHEIASLILRHRTLSKLKGTYVDALTNIIDKKTDRIHTSFNQTITATGRLSSSEPNLQNIPIRTNEGKEIRRAFIPQKDWLIISADYSQIELRILAHYSNDPILIKAFINDEDIHKRTATEVFNVFPSYVTGELRQHAKAINFGIIYGMSPFGLSQELGISQKMAKTYIDNYFLRYIGVKDFIDKSIEDARITKQTKTMLGRIRLLPEINSSNKDTRMFAERVAINTPIQGTAADLIKLAMIDIHTKIKQHNLKTKMLLSVHDDIIFESPKEEVDFAAKLIKESMEGIYTLIVPLKVKVAIGNNWEEAY